LQGIQAMANRTLPNWKSDDLNC